MYIRTREFAMRILAIISKISNKEFDKCEVFVLKQKVPKSNLNRDLKELANG